MQNSSFIISVMLFSDGSTLLHSELDDSFVLSLATNRVL